MNLALTDFNLSKAVFLDKVKGDLEVGVRIKAGTSSDKDLIRVWTDTINWQFSLVGLVHDNEITVQKLEIQSFGESIKYLKLTASVLETKLDIDLQKLSTHFAELSAVDVDEAKGFMDGYMNSSVNRTLTEKLFEEFASDIDQYKWLEL